VIDVGWTPGRRQMTYFTLGRGRNMCHRFAGCLAVVVA
jgi:hypothetical protein